jgi:hypothetical protein
VRTHRGYRAREQEGCQAASQGYVAILGAERREQERLLGVSQALASHDDAGATRGLVIKMTERCIAMRKDAVRRYMAMRTARGAWLPRNTLLSVPCRGALLVGSFLEALRSSSVLGVSHAQQPSVSQALMLAPQGPPSAPAWFVPDANVLSRHGE